MEALSGMLIGSQFILTIIMGIYFYSNLKTSKEVKRSTGLETDREFGDLRRLRNIKLTLPLSEKTRPAEIKEIIGQEKGLKALKMALCGQNPQHVIIYGPPGVGKTAAARVVLEYAKQSKMSPFGSNAPFVEIDATTLQFDERSIADPLIGSVHDPIYQGAGAYGSAGVPRPRPGAVTKAHGGVLFIDEIGELHNVQMNKLLKVLEDRKVFFNSSYYSPDNTSFPRYIHDIFKNGLPADFRLVGATTKNPEDIPPALRSRCTEIFFRRLNDKELTIITQNAFKKAGFNCAETTAKNVAAYAKNGREAVNIAQSALSAASLENRKTITHDDIEEVVDYGGYYKKSEKFLSDEKRIGVANGLGIFSEQGGVIIEIEAVAEKAYENGKGSIKASGIIEEEELNSRYGKTRRTGTAKSSIDNALTAMKKICGINTNDYDIHLNFPGGVPIDGPSAGLAVFIALYSAITGSEIPGKTAMTGEITLKGKIAAVGGVTTKIEAAIAAGADTVIIPAANYQKTYQSLNIKIVCVEYVMQALEVMFNIKSDALCHEIHKKSFLKA